MPRVQIKLSGEQLEALRRESSSTGQAVAVLVRQAIDDWVAKRDRDELWERALAVVGSAHSGLGDVAERHDDYLGDEGW